MTAIVPPSPPLDRFAIVEKIRSVLERSPAFREARISDPQTTPEGRVTVNVAFGRAPALFRVAAPSAEKAYAILYELAHAVVNSDAGSPRRDCA